MHRLALLLALGLISSAIVQAAAVPLNIFTDVGLTSQQIAAIDAGRPLAKVLPWGGPSEVYVFDAVHVEGSPETYLQALRDLGRLSGTPGYQGIGEIREDATVADLSALAFDPDDVKALKNCREDSCDVQLPTSGIQRFRDGLDRSRAHAADQANALARRGVLQLKADLILLGTHGPGGPPLAALGWTTEQVVHAAPCPVLTVHPPNGHV